MLFSKVVILDSTCIVPWISV